MTFDAPGKTSERNRTSRKGPGVLLAGLAFFSSVLFPLQSGATESLIPPFPPGIFYPVDTTPAPGFSGESISPQHPVFEFSGIPGWVRGKKVTNSMNVTIPKYEMMVIRGTKIRNGKIIIPAGGLYFDSSPARGEIPMTGASDYFFGHRYYFVDYDARIHLARNSVVKSGAPTAVGNHLYTLLSPPIPKVVPDPVVGWKTFDGVSIRPWAFSVRWEHPSRKTPDQRPLTYLQGVIHSRDQKTGAITFSSLSGTSIHSEWWAKTLVFSGQAQEAQTYEKGGYGIVVNRIDPKTATIAFHVVRHGKIGPERSLSAVNTPTLPEDENARKKMIAIDGPVAVVLWPHDAISGHGARLWVYSNVEHWTTNRKNFGFPGMAYFPIACPIAHHIGGMVYNTRPIVLTPGKSENLFGGYARILVVSIHDRDVQFKVTTASGSTPVFRNSGGIDAVLGEGRAAHGILSSLDATDLDLDRDLKVKE